jgi:hypothetical protein
MRTHGFIFSHCSKFQHWTSLEPRTHYAWDEILHAAIYQPEGEEVKLSTTKTIKLERGQVNLSTLRAREFFTESEWRKFVKRLVDDGMLEHVTTHKLGGENGSAAIYNIKNYANYQAKSPQKNERYKKRHNDGSKNVHSRYENQTESEETQSKNGTDAEQNFYVDGTKNGQLKEFNSSSSLSTLISPSTVSKKEGAEEKKSDPQTSEPQENSPTHRQALNFFRRFLGNGADWLAARINLEHVYEIWGEDALKKLWRECVSLNRNKPNDKPIHRFEDALKGSLDTQTKPLGVQPVMAAALSLSKKDLEGEMSRAKLVAGSYMPLSYLERNKVVTSLEVYEQLLREERLS